MTESFNTERATRSDGLTHAQADAQTLRQLAAEERDEELRGRALERADELDQESDVDEILVCADPECDSARIVSRNGKSGLVEGQTWRCQDCNLVFDEPRLRPPKQKQSQSVGGLSAAGRAALEWEAGP